MATSMEIPVERLIAGLRRTGGMNQILPNLYLGSLRDACDEDQLAANKIQCVISCHQMTAPNQVHARLGLPVLRINIADCISEKISPFFRETCRFIHDARLAGKAVLVHCLAGVSRSATIVAAYVIVACQLDFYEALNYITARRRSVTPNFAFRMQLCKFADKEADHDRELLRNECGPETFDRQFAKDRHETCGMTTRIRDVSSTLSHLRQEEEKVLSTTSDLSSL